MSKTQYKDTEYSYEILDNGYDIYRSDVKIIEQHDPFGKVFDPSGSYEDNCLKQLEQMTAPAPEPEPMPPTEEEKLRADVDYMALMLDVDLPSDNEEVSE